MLAFIWGEDWICCPCDYIIWPNHSGLLAPPGTQHLGPHQTFPSHTPCGKLSEVPERRGGGSPSPQKNLHGADAQQRSNTQPGEWLHTAPCSAQTKQWQVAFPQRQTQHPLPKGRRPRSPFPQRPTQPAPPSKTMALGQPPPPPPQPPMQHSPQTCSNPGALKWDHILALSTEKRSDTPVSYGCSSVTYFTWSMCEKCQYSVEATIELVKLFWQWVMW